jgi:5-methylcytosine-specific restriction protein B
MDKVNNSTFEEDYSQEGKSLIDVYNESSEEQRKEMFYAYMRKVDNRAERTVGNYRRGEKNVLGFVKEKTGKGSIYEVTNPVEIELIYQVVHDSQENKIGHYNSSATVKKYLEFINYLRKDNPEVPIMTDFSIARIISLIAETGLLYTPTLIKRFAFSLMSKQFAILSGLAGSGKTQLALAFASALIQDDSQMCVVPVGADWTNREPLLGFPNALQPNTYVRPESGVLDLLIEANKPENADKPYFLILDEMNMSYVERYFADFLSAMESHKAIPLWKGNDKGQTPPSILLPSNLLIIGTINVDETTYMFSPKVLDRANVIEFKISDEEMEKFLTEMKPVNRDSIQSKAKDMGADFVRLVKGKTLADHPAIKETLQSFFKDLKTVNAEFGYRSATEIYRFISQAMKCDDTNQKMTIDEIIDCAIVQKLLPKLHGSRKKLDATLNALWKECFKDEASKQTLPILKEYVGKAALPLTADKIQRMYEAAMANGFTSFSEA